jgi:DNA-binding NarL/FixJ family response regulator
MAGGPSDSGAGPAKPLPPLPIAAEKWAVLAKTLRLAPRQEKIVELILRGLQDKQIAAVLGLKVPTVRTYLRRVYSRLRVDDRMGLVLRLFTVSHELPERKVRHRSR